jgi:hypothetical protein
MLIIKAFINEKPIDEFHIHNTSKEIKKGIWLYEVDFPEKYRSISVLHKRSEGWMKLFRTVLDSIADLDQKTGPTT